MKVFSKTAVAVLALLGFLGGCSTLSVTAPEGMFLSMGDYVEGVETEGVVQAHRTAWTPFIVLYDVSEVREALYKDLLEKVRWMEGVDGITNITFYSKPSGFSVLAVPTFGIGIWMDYYAEGIVITQKR